MGLDSVELLMAVEEQFGIDITDAEAATADSVGKLYEIVLSKLGVLPSVPEAAVILERLKDVIVEETGVKREKLVAEARFGRDLGID